jgi:endonuclease YncB( thermonuclease family)
MQNLNKYLNVKSLIYILMLFVAYYLGNADLQKLASKKLNIDQTITNTSLVSGEYLVSKVVDGDTIHVVDSSQKEDIVRLLSVNTLEKNASSTRERCLAKMQTEFTETNLLNKKVYLYFDDTQPKRDKYNRLLAYVATTSTTNYFYNDLLMQTGNAKVFKATPPAANYSKYLVYQLQAEKEGVGMWNSELCK